MTEYRAHFDARVEFANGGGLSAEGFRIDLPTPDVTEADVARLFVRHLGLALVSRVSISNLVIAEEQHRGTRGIESPPASRGRLVDLSHTIRAGLVTYPGLPAPVITPHLTREQSIEKYAPGTQFAMDVITMIGNTGTYLDSPFHRFDGGNDLADLDLATLVDQPAEVFHLQDVSERGIPAEVFLDRDLAGKAVLLHTGWSSLFGTPGYATGAPFLTAEGARALAEAGVTLVGIDSLNIDDTEAGGERPAHTTLLGSGIHVVEHLTNLAALPPSGSTVTAVPPKIEGFGTFPVRVFAHLP
ncbi:cyclase family protein [Lacisediminihabitans profunda]|uniref:Cyclase family protein n=1 Tax=Lacisediminihabitans profunda TaxID=2594790 RepID=A0A5C8UXM2_9MICO|nr:cyclase family protein [Lacisediminihabitans profunda]TXN32432.1 cyclase family protein [Lacisediminihabitans profunda]